MNLAEVMRCASCIHSISLQNSPYVLPIVAYHNVRILNRTNLNTSTLLTIFPQCGEVTTARSSNYYWDFQITCLHKVFLFWSMLYFTYI